MGRGGTVWQRQGQLSIDVLDPSDQQVVWHGDVWARDPRFQLAGQVVADLMRKFPQVR